MKYSRGWGLGAPVERGETPPLSGSTPIDHCAYAQRIGQAAQRLIAQDCSGEVLAVVTGAIYILTEDSELCWLAQCHLPMHARAISVPFNATRVRQGMRFSAKAGRLHFDRDLFVDCETTATWDPPAIDPDRVARAEVVPERAQQLRQYAECNELPDRGRWIVRDIESACLERDFVRVVWSCQELIGMGPGLTPSGDDFVGGLVFTLYYLHALYPDLADWDQHLVHRLLEYATTQTNIISYNLLRDYAEGQAAAPLHRWLTDILSEETNGTFAESARQIVGIGSTSGSELLAGALTAMRFLDHRGDSDDNRYQTAN